MINALFFISDDILSFDMPAMPAENVYYCLPAHTGAGGSLEKAYHIIEQARLFPLVLAVEVRAALSEEEVRLITSCLFLPGYCRQGRRSMILLNGGSPELLEAAAVVLGNYIEGQGCREPIIHLIKPGGLSFYTLEDLEISYPALLAGQAGWNREIYFYPSEGGVQQKALAFIRQAEEAFRQKSPALYDLIRQHIQLGNELALLQEKQLQTSSELAHQQQYVEVLRSGNAARELQEYYTHEYEILPMWYKRFGHIVKVLTGKRTFRSLFRDDVKKYKD